MKTPSLLPLSKVSRDARRLGVPLQEACISFQMTWCCQLFQPLKPPIGLPTLGSDATCCPYSCIGRLFLLLLTHWLLIPPSMYVRDINCAC